MPVRNSRSDIVLQFCCSVPSSSPQYQVSVWLLTLAESLIRAPLPKRKVDRRSFPRASPSVLCINPTVSPSHREPSASIALSDDDRRIIRRVSKLLFTVIHHLGCARAEETAQRCCPRQGRKTVRVPPNAPGFKFLFFLSC